ncbi:MAG: carbamoyltransferase HypF [Burkholderiales bacterium]|nr:carbamoyltransferase HypF [Burkholderiales bacterium]MCP5291411.1 carbamoyltransferase HypF [Burkholderiales bacterium]
MIDSDSYTFTEIKLPATGPSVLACGAWLKNTVCITQGDTAYLSPVNGDLSTAEARDKLGDAVTRMCSFLSVKPEVVAHDLHPDFYSTEFGCNYAAQHHIPAIAVQHHHAHIAAICVEHQITGPVLGLALDGAGLGIDQTPWGGELLYVDGQFFRRLGHLSTLALPGGDRAAREPWRMAAAALAKLERIDEIDRRFPEQSAVQAVIHMLRHNINCPQTSSMGRLFDAAAGLLGVHPIQSHEAQAAISLQQLAEKGEQKEALKNGYRITADNQLDFLSLLSELADYPGVAENAASAAAIFHATLSSGLAEWVRQESCRSSGITRLVLGGGCFHNKLLIQGVMDSLSDNSICLYKPQKISPDDSAIALGQAWIALQVYKNDD